MADTSTTTEQDPEDGRSCCCSSIIPKDATDSKPLKVEEDKHAVLDNPDRNSMTSMSCLGSDWPALIVFGIAMVAVFVLWILAFSKGQVDIALYGMAFNGNICGKGATAAAPYQVWINPTATGSVFASAVCMPSCPTINQTNEFATNDTHTFATLNKEIASIPNAATRASAEANVVSLDTRVVELKNEVTYMSSHLGDTDKELDRSNIYCLCNKHSNYTLFKKFLSTKVSVDGVDYDMNARCSAKPAADYGYIALPYKEVFADFVGDGQNYLADPKIMDKVPCAFRYRTEMSFTRCMPWVSANAVGRITMVMGTSGIADGVTASFNAFSQRVVYYSNDIFKGAYVIAACSAIALILSIFLIFFMSASCCEDACQLLAWIVWGTLISLLFLLSGLTFVLAYQYKFYKDRYDTIPALTTNAEDEQAMYIYLVSACVAALGTFCHMIFISPCVCGEQIDASIQIIFAASKVFDQAWALLFFPVYHNLAIMIAIVCWLIGFLFISTAGEVVMLPQSGVHSLEYDKNFQNALLYYVFCIVWIVEFMGAVGFMITAGAILVVFFDSASDDKAKRWPLYESAKLVVCNHMGTAAIGSFFITCIVIVRWVIYMVLQKAASEDQSGFVKYIAACVNCICECIETCMRYMVNTAYILTVLEGRWFFSAVCGGLATLLSNAGTVLALNYIAFAVLWLCKLAVPVFCTTLAYVFIESGKLGVNKYDLSSSFNVLIPVFLISCIFSFTFLGLLGTSIDVVLIAYLKCEEIDKANPEIDIWSKIPKNCAAMKGHIDSGMDEEKQKAQDAAELDARAEGKGEGESLVKAEDSTDNA